MIPLGTGDLVGIASQTSLGNLLIPQSAADIFVGSESAILKVNPTSLDFGDVANGATADLTYEISGTSLIGDVVVTAPNYYTVSLDNATFGSTVTIPAATANAGATTVYVRFAPSAGVDQAVAGVLSHKSLSASVKSVDITGNETGNGGSTLLLNEQFDYGASSGSLISVSGGAWAVHSGTGPILYNTSSLSMLNYPNVGVGGAAQIPNPIGGEDANVSFSEQTTGAVYVSALVQISNAAATGTYFLHLKDGTATNFVARVYVQDAGSGQFKFGFGKATGGTSGVYSNNLYNYGTTYVVVIKQVLDGNTANGNDASSLYVLESVESIEPTLPLLTDATGTDRVVSSVAIRQANGSPAGAIIDGIRVALSWTDLFN